MDRNTSRILQELANAADEAKSAVQNAATAVGEKYDIVKAGLEMNRLEVRQEAVFSDIGRVLFLVHTGKVKDTMESDEGPRSPQQVIDELLISAEQIQQEIDAAEQRIQQESHKGRFCTKCGREAGEDDVYCAGCGAKLADK